MGWFEAIVLGLVQGLTEFLPISSSAHLRIVGELAGWDDPGAAFTAVSQIGTELAVVGYFRRDIWRIISRWFRALTDRSLRGDPDVRMGWLIIIGSIPIGLLGIVFQEQITNQLRDLRIIAGTLIVFGLVLLVADRVGSRDRSLDRLSYRHGVAIGIAQSLALVPGVSRSGATTAAGLFLGYTRAEAARYAFLLAVPAVLASGVYEAFDIGSDADSSWGPTILGTVIAGVVGYGVVAFFMRYITTHTFTPFVIYRLVLGVLVIVGLSIGTLNP